VGQRQEGYEKSEPVLTGKQYMEKENQEGDWLKPKLHLRDLLWICCGLYSKSTTSPRQIKLVEFGFNPGSLENVH